VIATASHGREDNILLVTLGLSIVIDNLALYLWSADTRTINPSYAFDTVDFGIAFVAVPKLISFIGALNHRSMLLRISSLPTISTTIVGTSVMARSSATIPVTWAVATEVPDAKS